MLLSPVNNKKLLFYNNYQLLTAIIANIIGSGKYNVRLEPSRYGHSGRDDKGCKGSVYKVSTL